MNQLLFSILFIFCFLTISLSLSSHPTKSGSIVFQAQKNGFQFVDGLFPDAVATGYFSDQINETGWGLLELKSNGAYSDQEQSYAMGFLEGSLTYERIWEHYQNIFSLDFGGNPPSDELVQWVNKQRLFLETNVKVYGTSPSDDPTRTYWYHVSLLLQQFNGLVEGYNAVSPNPISSLDLWLLNSDGDLETLLDIYPQSVSKEMRKLREDGEEYTDCSALIKLIASSKKKNTGDEGFAYEDLFTGHTTWRSYAAMLRIYKFYHTQFSEQSNTASNSVAFSASPGFLSSKDDFYITSSGLVSIETTNSIYNDTLYELYISPKTVLTWQRSILSNRLAKTGSDWVNIFAQYNSGTYNNQWMVVDYKVFEQLQTLDKHPTKKQVQGLLNILEQIPGTCQIGDVSDVLFQDGYWASYNIPYFENIYVESGYPARYEQYGDKYSYENCSRANIFRRDQPSVLDIDDMKRIMRYNDYQNDPYSAGNPTDSISSRYDLKASATYHDAFGGVDSKLTSASLVGSLSGYAQSGPTHDQQNAFSWSNWTKSVSDQPLHVGHPDTFDFDFVFFAPKLFHPALSPIPIPIPVSAPINSETISTPIINGVKITPSAEIFSDPQK